MTDWYNSQPGSGLFAGNGVTGFANQIDADFFIENGKLVWKRFKNEADYEAIVNGTEPDYTAWLAKVAEIKLRYPFT